MIKKETIKEVLNNLLDAFNNCNSIILSLSYSNEKTSKSYLGGVRLIKSNIDWMLILFDFFCLIKLKILTRFIPICDVSVFPENLSKSQRKKWAIMDTFDAFSPKYDNPMRIKKVRKLLIEMGCKVNFSGLIKFDKNASGAVVRAIKL